MQAHMQKYFLDNFDDFYYKKRQKRKTSEGAARAKQKGKRTEMKVWL